MDTHSKSDAASIRRDSLPLEEEKEQESTSPVAEEPNEKPQQSSPLQDQYEYVTGFKLVIVIVAITLVAFLMMLDMSIIVTAIPRITNDFHSLTDVGWYGSAYQLASASLQPLTGKLYTYFKSKRLFLGFFFIFELGSLLCGVATSSMMLIIGRAVAGIGTSGLMNGALTILSACIPLQKRPVYLGVMMGFSQFGIVFGPLLGGALTSYATWRWCFYINLPIGGVVAVLLILIKIPDRIVKIEGNKNTIQTVLKKLDLIGFAIFAPAAIQFLLALQWGGNQYAWDSSHVIGLLCGAAATLLVFLAWEYREGDGAMIPFSMLRQRIVWSSCLVSFFFMGLVMCATYYLPIYFQAVKNASPMMSGVYVLPSILSQMVLAVASGVLVTKLGYYLPWILGSSALSAVAMGLFSTLAAGTSTGKWVGYQILAGIARGAGLQMSIIAVQNTLPQSQVSVAISILVFSQTFGGAIFLTFAETIFTNGLVKSLGEYAPTVDAQVVINAGATAFRSFINKADLADVLKAYSKAVDEVFYLGVGCALGSFIFAWGMGWKDIREKKTVQPEA